MAGAHNLPAHPITRNLGSLDSTKSIALIVVSAVAGSFLVVLAVFVLVRRGKRRRHKRATQPAPLPHLAAESDISIKQRPDLHIHSVSEDEELQRQAIIQKSLACRTSLRVESRTSLLSPLSPQSCGSLGRLSQHDEDELSGRTARSSSAGSLRDEWKEFEANLQRNQSRSLVNHPGLKTTNTTSHGRNGSQGSTRGLQIPVLVELRDHPAHLSQTRPAGFPQVVQDSPRPRRLTSATLPPPRHSIFHLDEGEQHRRRVTLQEQQLRGQAWI